MGIRGRSRSSEIGAADLRNGIGRGQSLPECRRSGQFRPKHACRSSTLAHASASRCWREVSSDLAERRIEYMLKFRGSVRFGESFEKREKRQRFAVGAQVTPVFYEKQTFFRAHSSGRRAARSHTLTYARTMDDEDANASRWFRADATIIPRIRMRCCDRIAVCARSCAMRARRWNAAEDAVHDDARATEAARARCVALFRCAYGISTLSMT